MNPILSASLVAAERIWLPIERARLSLKGEHRLARALGTHPCTLCDRIEEHRQRMLKDQSPLIDGSLGPAARPAEQNHTVADACRVSKRRHSARRLHSLAAEFRPAIILEMGTNVGISSAYLAAAGGKVTTLEGSPYRLRLAQKLHQELGLAIDYVEGVFSETLGPTLDRIAPVEMAFVDGDHQYRATLDYFEAIATKAAPGCVFIFDDIRWSPGMRRAWKKMRPRFEAVADLGGMGVGVLPDPSSRNV